MGDLELFFVQRCLTAFFGDRKQLDKSDLSVVHSLGFKFRRAKGWPQFRSYRPGYFPWHLTEGEASFLAVALEQALEVGDRFRANPDLLSSPSGKAYLLRTPHQTEGQWTWQDEWLEPETVAEKKLSFAPLDEPTRARIKEKRLPSDEVWEGDFFHLEKPVAGEGRPFFPRLFVWADARSGFILGHDMNTPDEPITPLRDCLIEVLERSDVYPREIRVRKKEAVELLAPLAESLQIKLVKTRTLRSINRFRRTIPDFFRLHGE